MKLERGGQVPHVSVRGLDGTTITYRDIWQRKNLVLVSFLPEREGGDERGEASYLAALQARDQVFREHEAEVVITRDPVAGLPAPAVLIADRWGEIAAVQTSGEAASLLSVDEILEWLHFIARACPECEAEAK